LLRFGLMKNEATKNRSKHWRGRGSKPVAKKSTDSVPDGSLIDRRVGHGSKNVGAALARRRSIPDTSAPGSSASDKRAGRGSTAARNTLARAPKATAMLEDSAKTRPSRKSTRRSANRTKQGTELTHKTTMKNVSPSARATARR
jgi:hypothetical protein